MIFKLLGHRISNKAARSAVTAPDPSIKDPKRLAQLAALTGRSHGGRIAFVIDATSSRQSSWLEATAIQTRMVAEAAQYGKLSMRIVHFGGSRVSAYPPQWTDSVEQIINHMRDIHCVGGVTQIIDAINLAIASSPPPTLIVVIGDGFEESHSDLVAALQTVKKLSIPIFAFLESGFGHDKYIFRMMSTETGGVFAKFGDTLDLSSLMVATATYAAGGTKALLALAHSPHTKAVAAKEILQQLLTPPRK